VNILRLLRFFISLTFLSLFWPSLISRWRTHFREARLRDLDLDDSRKRGHLDVHLEFLHFSNSPPPPSPPCEKLDKLSNNEVSRLFASLHIGPWSYDLSPIRPPVGINRWDTAPNSNRLCYDYRRLFPNASFEFQIDDESPREVSLVAARQLLRFEQALPALRSVAWIVPSSTRRHDAKTLFYFAIDVSDDPSFDVGADFGGPPNVQEPPKTMVRPSGRATAEYSS